MGAGDAAVKAMIRVLDNDHEFVITPSFVIRDRMVARKPEVNNDLGLRVQFQEINPQTGQFTFAVNTTQRDFIVMKATEKPLINILWLGTFVMVIGLVMATIRRFRDFIKMRDRENATANKNKDKMKPQVA